MMSALIPGQLRWEKKEKEESGMGCGHQMMDMTEGQRVTDTWLSGNQIDVSKSFPPQKPGRPLRCKSLIIIIIIIEIITQIKIKQISKSLTSQRNNKSCILNL